MCSAAANLLFALYVFSHLTSYFSEGGDGDAGSSLETRSDLLLLLSVKFTDLPTLKVALFTVQ